MLSLALSFFWCLVQKNWYIKIMLCCRDNFILRCWLVERLTILPAHSLTSSHGKSIWVNKDKNAANHYHHSKVCHWYKKLVTVLQNCQGYGMSLTYLLYGTILFGRPFNQPTRNNLEIFRSSENTKVSYTPSHTFPDDLYGRTISQNVTEKHSDSRHYKLRKQYEYNWIDKHKHTQAWTLFYDSLSYITVLFGNGILIPTFLISLDQANL